MKVPRPSPVHSYAANGCFVRLVKVADFRFVQVVVFGIPKGCIMWSQLVPTKTLPLSQIPPCKDGVRLRPGS